MINFKEWCIDNNREDLLLGYDNANNPNPENVAKGSHVKLSWICKKCKKNFLRAPHNILATTENICSSCKQEALSVKRHLAAVQKNNFAEKYPLLAEEWDTEKNSVAANEVSFNDNHQYFWVCKRCGNSYKSVIINRIKGSQCPKCNAIWHTSFPEQAVFYYLKNVFEDALLRDKSIGRELDIYIPSIHCGIEYDGVAWHRKNKNYKNDLIKEQMCSEKGIRLIRIREIGLNELEYKATTDVLYVESGSDLDLELAIRRVFELLQIGKIDINLKRDRNDILAGFVSAKRDNALSIKYPDLANEWNYDKNTPIKPEDIDYGSGYNAWWVCSKCGYEFQTTVNARTCKGSGCPACCNFVLFRGHNDFITWCKENDKENLLKEWDYERNFEEDIDITTIIHRGGAVKANWICPKGHGYKQLIYNRTINRGCPICAHERKYIENRNIDKQKSLLMTHPELSKEWNYEKNAPMNPSQYFSGSGKKVWWRCSNGHEWDARICNRVRGVGCPYCTNKKVMPGYNDLATLNPVLASEWDYERNAGLANGNNEDISTPDKVTAVSGQKVWWLCSKGHSWKAPIYNREKGTGCPFCSGRRQTHEGD